MPITFNNGIANIVGTPGAASGVFADRPNAADVADGTLYFATDTIAIYQAVAGSWVNYSGGGGGSTGINGLNGTTNIGLGGTLSNDTSIDCANFDLSIFNLKILSLLSTNGTGFFLVDNQIYTINPSANNYGLLIDFATNVVVLGDPTNILTLFQINSGNSFISSSNAGQEVGLKLDFANNTYQFGDFNSDSFLNINSTYILLFKSNAGINIQSGLINTKYAGNEIGLYLDFANAIYNFGDYANNLNGTTFVIDDFSNIICTRNSLASNEGIFINMSNHTYYFGDIDITNNGTTLTIDDNNQKIKFKNTAGSYNFSNMPAYANNTAALAAGLVVGDLYRHNGIGESQDQLRIVH
jgi:hypothetical protein